MDPIPVKTLLSGEFIALTDMGFHIVSEGRKNKKPFATFYNKNFELYLTVEYEMINFITPQFTFFLLKKEEENVLLYKCSEFLKIIAYVSYYLNIKMLNEKSN